MFLKSGGTLFVLALLTSFIASLLLTLSILNNVVGYVSAAVLLVFGFLNLFLAFFKSDEKSPKACYIFVGGLNIISGFIWFFIGTSFHTLDSYLNRAVIYMTFNIAICTALGSLWPFVTRKVFGPLLASTSFDKKEESLLYVLLNILYGLLISLVVPAAKSLEAYSCFSLGLSYSIGIWFLNGFIGLGVGYILTTKAGSHGPTSMAAPISAGSDYDGIN